MDKITYFCILKCSLSTRGVHRLLLRKKIIKTKIKERKNQLSLNSNQSFKTDILLKLENLNSDIELYLGTINITNFSNIKEISSVEEVDFLRTKKSSCLQKSLLYYGVILCFVVGAIIGNKFVILMKERAILICSAILFVAFIMMFVDREKQEHEKI